MATALSPADFLQASQRLPIIDVRSPGEYSHAHIPGAINIPLFSNDERVKVGTCYKQQGRDAAVRLGLEMVGPKLALFVKKADLVAPQREVRPIHRTESQVQVREDVQFHGWVAIRPVVVARGCTRVR